MNQFISKEISIQEFILVSLVLLLLYYETAVADPSIIFDDEAKTSAKEPDLSVDLKKSYNDSTRPNFTGVWLLDPSTSDDPKEVLKELKKRKKGYSERSNRGGFRKDSGNMGRGTAQSTGKRPNTMRKGGKNIDSTQFSKLLVNEMEILHQEPLLKINSKQYGEQRIHTDFSSSSVSAMGGVNQLVTVAGWEGNSLIIETTRSNGQKSIQKLKLLSDPQRIERITELSIQSQDNNPVKIKQVYLMNNQTTERNVNTASDF